jgi:acyl carrier protein phosphodiesterase
MNFLAHFTLSFRKPELLYGQFIADAIKGKNVENYRGLERLGIELHRLIDSTTDTSEACQELRKELRPHIGLFSPVAIDMYLDHVLARDFHNITGEQLSEFAPGCIRSFKREKVKSPTACYQHCTI